MTAVTITECRRCQGIGAVRERCSCVAPGRAVGRPSCDECDGNGTRLVDCSTCEGAGETATVADEGPGPILPGFYCQWFAACEQEATQLVAHPVLGDVPTCDRCVARLGLEVVR